MFKSYYGMNKNPFLKNESGNNPYNSNDYKEMINRLYFIKEIRGIAIFTGTPGLGKTFNARNFVNNLNKDLYKVIYIDATPEMSNFDFFKIISDNLNIDIGACYKSDIYKNVQNEIVRIVDQDKVNIMVIIDDAHYLSREILLNLKIFYDFKMDSKDYVSLVLIGQPEIKTELNKKVHETLNQRIIVNYTLKGLSREEVKEYVKTRLEICNANKEIFTPDALNSLYSCSKSSPRRLNTLIINSLMLGYQNKKTIIDSEIIMYAKDEMELK